MRHDLGRDNVFFLHVSLVPYIGPSGELKTKPTQHSVAALRSIGIQPDAIVLRADRDVPEATKRKIALMCDVDVEGVVTAKDAPSIYDIPRVLHSEGLDAYVVQRLALPFRDVEWKGWDELLRRVHEPAHRVEVALVGKYIDLPDAYLSVTEALRAGGFHHDAKVVIRWVRPTTARRPRVRASRSRVSTRSWSRAASACAGSRASSARCAGRARTWSRRSASAWACSAWSSSTRARSWASTARPPRSSTTTRRTRSSRRWPSSGRSSAAPATSAAPCGWARTTRVLTPGSVVAETYGAQQVSERHRHRYEVNNSYRDKLEEAGLVISGVSPDTSLVEFVELPRDVHPYYVATQAHPEFKSRPTRAHPLFAGLVGAALAQRGDES